jgi:hypothetical protein
MRLDPNKEAFLIFADSFWDLDNGKSAIEIIQEMMVKHVEDARKAAYGYQGELDESIERAGQIVAHINQDNLLDTVSYLCDLGSGDDVARALKNVVLLAIQRNTGAAKQVTGGGADKIVAGKNRSSIRFNGTKVKRRSMSDPAKVFNGVVAEVHVNAGARSIMEAAARKTQAAQTLRTTINTGGKMTTKFDDDDGMWTTYAKQEAKENNGLPDGGRMKSDTVAGRSVEVPSIRMQSFEDTRSRLPFEFSGVNQSQVRGVNLDATVDVVDPSGSAHGPIEFRGDVSPAVGQTKNYVGPLGKHHFPMSQQQQFPGRVHTGSIESGPNV